MVDSSDNYMHNDLNKHQQRHEMLNHMYRHCESKQTSGVATIQATEAGALVKIMRQGRGHIHVLGINRQYFGVSKLFKEMQLEGWKYTCNILVDTARHLHVSLRTASKQLNNYGYNNIIRMVASVKRITLAMPLHSMTKTALCRQVFNANTKKQSCIYKVKTTIAITL